MAGNIKQEQLGVVQRALQLAGEGKLKTVSEVQRALMREEYEMVPQYLSGQSIRRQIKSVIKQHAIKSTTTQTL